MRRRYHRIREILTVFFNEGFEVFLKEAELHRFITWGDRLRNRLQNREDAINAPEKLRIAFEKLGPTFIKFGQMLSLRPDFLTSEYIREMEKLQDKVPPFPWEQAKEIIERELKGKVNEIFSEFNAKPIASASISQVYKAKTKKGEIVAVKVQRPETEQMREDMEIMLWLAKWLQKKSEKISKYRLVSIIEDFKRWTELELNFLYEATNAKVLAANFKGDKDVYIPPVYEALTTRKVLTLGFVEGKPLHEITSLSDHNKAKKILGLTYRSMMQMVYRDGFFHADPHAGNILFTSAGKIAYVDFGIVGRFEEKMRSNSLKIFSGIIDDDLDRVIPAFMEIAIFSEETPKENIYAELVELFAPIKYEKLKDVDIGFIFRQLMEVTARYQLIIPISFVLFIKTISTLEGLGLRYDPNFRLMEFSGPVIKDILNEEYAPGRLAKKVKGKLSAYEKMLAEFPPDLLAAVKKIGSGRFNLELNHTELDELRAEMEHGSGNMVFGLITAALIIAAAVSMLVLQEPKIIGIPIFAFFSFLLALILAVWLAGRTFVPVHKI